MASMQALVPLDQAGKRLARGLTALLRHGKPKKLPLRPDAFVSLDDIRTVKGFEGLTLDIARSIVHEDNKMRFSLQQEDDGKWYIRANQGHTIQGIDEHQLLTRVQDPSEIPIAVHGTYFMAWPSIKQTGLSKMERTHIHFAKGLPDESGVISGMRRSTELLIYLDVGKAMAAGATFFISANGVILTSGVGDSGCIPPDCFRQVVNNTNGVVIFGEGCTDGAEEERLLQWVASQPQGGGKGKGKGNNKQKPRRSNGPPELLVPVDGSGGGGGGKGKGAGKGGKGGGGGQAQFKWPEFVGMRGEEAATALRERFPQLKVAVVKLGAPVTMDHDLKRVRVFIDDDEVVAKPPKLG
jgi:2'-phosphotransferase